MISMDLGSKKCVPCEGGVNPFASEKTAEYLKLVSGWSVENGGKGITKKYSFRNFKDALSFVNQVGEIAESEGHHPDVELGWGRVVVHLMTHAIKGLSENDFILAYKIDRLHP